MDKSKMTHYIKVNFPETADGFTMGYGEGMWVLVDDDTKAAHDTDKTGGHYVGILANDSIYFDDLVHGSIVHFEMRGDKRPVAFYPVSCEIENNG